MKAHVGIAIATGALATALAGTALAQQQPYETETTPSYMRAPVRAPRNALEIGVNTGYSQGFGKIARGETVGRTADAGFGAGLNLAYRATPGMSIGAVGQFQGFNPDDRLGSDAKVRGVTAGVDATFHFAPYERVDPFLSLGSGYRLLWTMPKGPRNDVLTHGFELARLNLGLDMRVSPDIAVGPMIGADLDMFVWRNPEGSAGNSEIDGRRVSTFIYGGVQGRFDVGGQREAQIREEVGRR
jgi:opacity protein-like surface antigen